MTDPYDQILIQEGTYGEEADLIFEFINPNPTNKFKINLEENIEILPESDTSWIIQ